MKPPAGAGRKNETDLRNFEQDVLPHLDAAYNLARWLTRNDNDAQDVVQQACICAVRYSSSLRCRNTALRLLKIVHDTFYKSLQQDRAGQLLEEFDKKPLDCENSPRNPTEIAVLNDDGQVLRKALEALPLNLREVLILRELEGLSYKEIAEITGTPPGTMMSELARARDGLRQLCGIA